MGVLDDAIREHLELKRRHGASDEEIERAEAEALGPARREPSYEPLAGAETLGVPPRDEAELLEPDLAEPELAGGGETVAFEPGDVPSPGETVAFEPGDAPSLDDEALPPLEPADLPPTAVHRVEPAPLGYDDEAPPPSESAAEPHGDPLAPLDSPSTGGEPPADEPTAEREAVELPPATSPHGDPAFDDDFEPDEVPSDEQLAPRAPLPPRDFDEEGPPQPALPREDDSVSHAGPVDDPVGEPPVHEPPVDLPPPADEPPPAAGGAHDAIEETPDFQQDTSEHDRLWFEQKPRRDFDFDE